MTELQSGLDLFLQVVRALIVLYNTQAWAQMGVHAAMLLVLVVMFLYIVTIKSTPSVVNREMKDRWEWYSK